MSPPVRLAMVDRSRRAWERETPARAATSLAMTAPLPFLVLVLPDCCRMACSQAWTTLLSGGVATSSSLRIGRPLGPRICVRAEEDMCKGDDAVDDRAAAAAAVTRGGRSAEADGWVGLRRRRPAPDVPMGAWNPDDTEADDDATISAHAAVLFKDEDGMALLLCYIDCGKKG